MRTDRKLIENENWKKSPGVNAKEGDTNSALAARDYKVPCNTRYVIAVIKGYHIWWCSAHHQPSTNCQAIKAMIEELEKLKMTRTATE